MFDWRVRSMLQDLLSEFATALEAARIDWMVIGGQAVLVYGDPRLTRDVDITVGVGPERLDDLLAIIAGLGWSPLVDPEEFTRQTLVLPCRVPESPLRVDLVLADSPYEAEALRRARDLGAERADGVRYATPEDLIIHKVIAGRPRDLEDARSVLLRRKEIDRNWIRRWIESYEELLGEPLSGRFDEIDPSR
jgi:hypothetical protein